MVENVIEPVAPLLSAPVARQPGGAAGSTGEPNSHWRVTFAEHVTIAEEVAFVDLDSTTGRSGATPNTVLLVEHHVHDRAPLSAERR